MNTYIVKGIIKNYDLSTIDKIISFASSLIAQTIVIRVYEARGKFQVIIYYDIVKFFSEEFDVKDLEKLKEALEKQGYVHVVTDLIHELEPIQLIIYQRPILKVFR